MTSRTLASEGTAGRALVVLDRASVPAMETGARLIPLLDEWIGSDDGTGGLMLFRVESLVPQQLLDDGWLPIYAGEGVGV